MPKPIVIKYGGSLLEDLQHRTEFLKQIKTLGEREKVVLVHGGGKEISRQMEQAGLQPRFVNGRRFTDEATMSVVKKALSTLNKQIVDELVRCGASAKGYSGQERHLLEAAPVKELGRVGLPRMVDSGVLQELIAASPIPVFYSVAEDIQGEPLNINADDFALALAVACKARQLVFLTDTGGILDQQGRVVHTVSAGDIDRLVSTQVITGGMTIKAQACIRALQEGVGRVDIVKGIDHLLDSNRAPFGTLFVHPPEILN